MRMTNKRGPCAHGPVLAGRRKAWEKRNPLERTKSVQTRGSSAARSDYPIRFRDGAAQMRTSSGAEMQIATIAWAARAERASRINTGVSQWARGGRSIAEGANEGRTGGSEWHRQEST